jgi:hypothetical protein
MPDVEVEYSRFGSIGRLKGHTKLFISPGGRAVKVNRGGGGSVAIDSLPGEIIEAGFDFIPDYGLPGKPKISAKEARRIASEAVESPTQAAKGSVTTSTPEFKYYRSHRMRETTTMVWQVHTSYRPQGDDPNEGHTVILVDAVEGLSIESWPGAMHAT